MNEAWSNGPAAKPFVIGGNFFTWRRRRFNKPRARAEPQPYPEARGSRIPAWHEFWVIFEWCYCPSLQDWLLQELCRDFDQIVACNRGREYVCNNLYVLVVGVITREILKHIQPNNPHLSYAVRPASYQLQGVVFRKRPVTANLAEWTSCGISCRFYLSLNVGWPRC